MSFPKVIEDVIEKAKSLKKEEALYLAGGVAAAGLVGSFVAKKLDEAPSSGPYPTSTLPKDAYDAIIVGAGPSGSVCGHYLAR